MGPSLSTKLLASRWPVSQARHATPDEIATLPLHTKNVKAVQVETRLAQMRNLLGDVQCVKDLQFAVDLFANDRGTEHIADQHAELSEPDMQMLESNGLIEQELGPSHVNTVVFSVPELAKNRRRWITHTPFHNDRIREATASAEVPFHGMPSIADTMSLSSGVWAMARCIDFKSYFHQFGIRNFACHYIFKDKNGRKWRLCTSPTGASTTPAIAQHYAKCFVALVLARLGWDSSRCRFDVYIDNIRWMADSLDDINRITHVVFACATECNIEINETIAESLQSDPHCYTFLGITYDHKAKTTQLAASFIQKLNDILAEFQCNYAHWTAAEALSVFGKLQYAAQINRSELAPYYHIFKFMRRRAAARVRLAEPIEPWPSIVHLWEQWLHSEIHAPPRVNTRPLPSSADLFTDASSSGMGIVLLRPGCPPSIWGRHWSPAEKRLHINVLEATATRDALWYTDLSGVDAVALHIDNTSLLFCLQKSRSRSYLLNERIAQIRRSPQFSKIVTMDYVKSECNLADEPSRRSWFNDCVTENSFLDSSQDWPVRTEDHPAHQVCHPGDCRY